MTPDVVIRNARRSAGLTQTELAERLGMSQASVARLERPGANLTFATLHHTLNAMGHTLEISSTPGPSGVDETLVARNLRMSPAERLAAFEIAHQEVSELRALMPPRADGAR